MSDLRSISHRFIGEFISMYHERPYLWNQKHELYMDDDSKSEGYEDLRQKLLEVDKYATIHTVKSKIAGLRSCFRRELRKIENAEKTGKHCKITLWYFPLLTFITDKKIPQSILDKFVSKKVTDAQISQPTLPVGRCDIPSKIFIDLYREHECLWNVKSKNFYNKDEKLKALEIITKKLSENGKEVTIDTVKIKIKSLRRSFMRALCKVRKAQKKNQTYIPSLYFFNDLLFLIKDNYQKFGFKELPSATPIKLQSSNTVSKRKKNDDSYSGIESSDSQNSDFLEFENINFEDFSKTSPLPSTLLDITPCNQNLIDEEIIKDEEDTNISEEIFTEFQDESNSIKNSTEGFFEFKNMDIEEFSPQSSPRKDNFESERRNNLENIPRKRKINEKNKSKETKNNSKQEEIINSLIKNSKEDDVDTYSKYVACELRRLSDNDRTFVKKVFNDALFEAKIGNAQCMRLVSNTRLQIKIKKND